MFSFLRIRGHCHGRNKEIIYAIIDKAREFHGKEGVVIPENPAELNEDDFTQILANHKNDLTHLEVKKVIDDLEPDQQMTLVVIMYLGRGDFSIDEWNACFAEAKRGWTTHTAWYLLSKPHVADYLEEGLNLIEIN